MTIFTGFFLTFWFTNIFKHGARRMPYVHDYKHGCTLHNCELCSFMKQEGGVTVSDAAATDGLFPSPANALSHRSHVERPVPLSNAMQDKTSKVHPTERMWKTRTDCVESRMHFRISDMLETLRGTIRQKTRVLITVACIWKICRVR